jgi:hypothetical protein
MAMATKGAMGMSLAMVIALSIVLTVTADGECSVAAPCPDKNNCCSQFGFCGTGAPYCGNGCQAGPCTGGTPPSPPSGGGGLGDILTRNLYEQLFPGHLSFYSYDKLIEASKLFPQFGTTGDSTTRKREIAAFAAHVTQETSGLKVIVEQTNDPYCDGSRPEFPCNGKHFNGRGPLQLSWNYNYGTCGNYLKRNLLGNPDLVATDPLVSFEASLWFWNQYGDNVIPHIHDVITGNWNPTTVDKAANRVPGFGVTIDIINGGLECGKQSNEADNRVKYFKNFCSQMNISPGDNVDCKKMKPFYSVKLTAES